MWTVNRRRSLAASLALAALTTFGSPVPAGASTPPPRGPKGIVPVHTANSRFGAAPRLSATPGPRPSAVRRTATPPAATATLEYHGGPVMRSTRVYTIFWQPSTLPSGVQAFPSSPSYTETVNGYFAAVAADSGKQSNVYSLDPQYSKPGQAVEYLTTFPGAAGSYADTEIDAKPFPTSGCTDLAEPGGAALPVCLTEEQLTEEIATVVKAKGWPTGLQDMVFLYTPSGVGSCFNAGPESEENQCSYTYYCAYHYDFQSVAKLTVFADMPYAATPTCDDGARPGGSKGVPGSTAGPAIDATSHEHNEAITDPTGQGWWDGAGTETTNADYGYENGDLCVLPRPSETYGPLLPGSSGYGTEGAFNQLIDGAPYLLQMEWSNLSAGCAQRLSSESSIPPPKEPSKEPVKEPIKEPIKEEPTKEPAKEPTPEPASTPTLPQGSSGSSPLIPTTPTAVASLGSPKPAPKGSQPKASSLTAYTVARLLGLPASGANITATRTVTLGHASCPPACLIDVRLVATVPGSSGRHRHARRITIGTARLAITGHGARTLVVTLNAAGRALLRADHRLAVALNVAVHGLEGAHWTVSRSLRLLLQPSPPARHSRRRRS